MTLFHKVPYGEGVLEDITGCEALVRLNLIAQHVSSAFASEKVGLTMSKKGKCFFSFMTWLSSFH